MPGELCKDERLKLKDEISRAMKNTIDRLHSEINGRFERLMDMDSKFGFLLDIKSLCYEDVENLKKSVSIWEMFITGMWMVISFMRK